MNKLEKKLIDQLIEQSESNYPMQNAVSDCYKEFLNNIPKGGTILDLGCGSGRDSKAFIDKGYKITAVDGSKELAQSASKLIGQDVLVSKFKESLFFNHLDVDTRDEALENITSKLIDECYITQCVKENIFKREDLASTEIGELVAIPHDMNEEIKQSFISVSVFNKAITWDKEKVQVVFFIGMSTVDKEEWKSYLEQIYKNIIDGEIIRKIIKCQNFEELKMLVSKF